MAGAAAASYAGFFEHVIQSRLSDTLLENYQQIQTTKIYALQTPTNSVKN